MLMRGMTRAVLLALAAPFVLLATSCVLFPSLDDLDARHDAGSSSGDSATVDSGFGDGGDGDGGTSPACPPAAFLCDDFEGPLRWDRIRLRDPATAKVVQGAVGPVSPVSGNAMLQLTTEVGSGDYANVEKALPARSSGVIAMRAFAYFTNAPASRTTALAFIARDAAGNIVSLLKVRAADSGVWSWSTSHPSGDRDHGSSESIAFGKWSCIEMVAAIGTTGHVAFFVDGRKVIDADDDTAPQGAPYGVVAAGMYTTSGAQREELFMDDVVVATFDDGDARSARIGCGR